MLEIKIWRIGIQDMDMGVGTGMDMGTVVVVVVVVEMGRVTQVEMGMGTVRGDEMISMVDSWLAVRAVNLCRWTMEKPDVVPRVDARLTQMLDVYFPRFSRIVQISWSLGSIEMRNSCIHECVIPNQLPTSNVTEATSTQLNKTKTKPQLNRNCSPPAPSYHLLEPSIWIRLSERSSCRMPSIFIRDWSNVTRRSVRRRSSDEKRRRLREREGKEWGGWWRVELIVEFH